MWNASHLAVRLCALRHWKRVSMPPTIQSLGRCEALASPKGCFLCFLFQSPQYLSTEPFNPLESYLRRFFDFLGGDRALGENSDSLTANSLTPNHYFYGLLRIFLENWENHFKFGGHIAFTVCLWATSAFQGLCVCLLGAMLAFLGGCVWLLGCVVDCGVHNWHIYLKAFCFKSYLRKSPISKLKERALWERIIIQTIKNDILWNEQYFSC